MRATRPDLWTTDPAQVASNISATAAFLCTLAHSGREMRDYRLYFLKVGDDGAPHIYGVATAPFETDEEAVTWANARSDHDIRELWAEGSLLKTWGIPSPSVEAA